MSKYIKAEVLKNNIHKLVWTQDMKSVEKFVDSLPAADVQEVRHGHWIDVIGDGRLFECSACGRISCCNEAYCNECGAKMDEVGE